MPTVALAITGAVSLLEVAAACEVFGTDRRYLHDPWYEFTVCAPEEADLGLWFDDLPRRPLERLSDADTVIVPPCLTAHDRSPTALVEAVREAHLRGRRVVALCTGAFVLAEAGVLDHRRATTHWLHSDLLAQRFPAVTVEPDSIYVEDDNVFTSAGKSAGIDLCLHIVRLDYGSSVANTLARRLVVNPHRDGGQDQYVERPALLDQTDGVLVALLPWVFENLGGELTVEDLARRANMSSRTLSRHFRATLGTSPLQWLLGRRVRRAQELLETSSHSIESIAEKTGMGSAATLRRNFTRVTGVPPESYRRTFRGRRVTDALDPF